MDMVIVAHLILNFILLLRIYLENRIMGQTCNQTTKEFYLEPIKMNETANTANTTAFNTTQGFKAQPTFNNTLAESKLLRSRTSCVNRRNDNLSQMVKSRLTQLPDFSIHRKQNFGNDKQVYLQQLKANYCGQIEKGKPQGYGSLQFQNGDYLQGEFTNGRCEGRGRYIKSNGSYYEGDLKNNVADGFGKYFDKNGYKYQGQWKYNMPNGRGQAHYPNQSRYNGQFFNYKRHGKGVLMQKGNIFEGQFINNKLQGHAKMQNTNGETYDGQWKMNEKHGRGQYVWPNGNKYVGQYSQGKRHGFGTMHYHNGQIYDGHWSFGKKHGTGSYTALKETISGYWQKGQLAEQKIQKISL